MFYTVFEALANDFLLSSLAAIAWEVELFPQKNSKVRKKSLSDRVALEFVNSRNTCHLYEKLIPLVLFSPIIQEEEQESLRHHFLQFESAEVAKRIGLFHRKPDMKFVPPQSTQLIDL